MIHGINLDGETETETDTDEAHDLENYPAVKPEPVFRQTPLMFGDPGVYDKMSPEQREDLTNKMMKKWSRWAGKSSHPLGQRKTK